MEQFLDALIAFLVAHVGPQLPGTTGFILGDPTTSAPTSLPFVYIVPLYDSVKPYAVATDEDTYVIPILLVDDLQAYGAPIPNINVAGAFEQPGYRKLMQWGQIIRAELRAGGAAITMGGISMTSVVPAISYVWAQIDNKPYRGVRIALQVQQRRAQQASP